MEAKAKRNQERHDVMRARCKLRASSMEILLPHLGARLQRDFFGSRES